MTKYVDGKNRKTWLVLRRRDLIDRLKRAIGFGRRLKHLNGDHGIEQKLNRPQLEFDSIERAMSNEFYQAIKLARKPNANVKLLKQAARLYVNYVNKLMEKKYFNELDRNDTSYEQLNGLANFLIEKLKSNDYMLSEQLKDVKSQYRQMRHLNRSSQISSRGFNVVELAQQRLMQSVHSQVRHLKRKINRQFETILYPIKHPLETAKKIFHFFLTA